MAVTMRADLVASLRDVSHQGGEFLGDPSKDEEGGLDLPAGEELEQDVSVGHDARRRRRHAAQESLAYVLVPVLDVDRQDVPRAESRTHPFIPCRRDGPVAEAAKRW